MSTLRNSVQLIGNEGNAPEVKTFENGKKVANLSLAINEVYTNSDGEKIKDIQWHRVVAFGKTAEIIEKFVTKGKEIAIEGKLSTRSYDDKNSEKRYVTEVIVNEVILFN